MWRAWWLIISAWTLVGCGDSSASGGGAAGAPGAGGAAGAPQGGEGGAGGAAEPPRIVSLEISPAVAPELPSTDVVFRLALDGPPPEGGTRVYVRGDVPQSLTQLDLFGLNVLPPRNDKPVGDLTFSGFTLLLSSQEVEVRLPTFDDGAGEAPVTVTFEVVPFEAVDWGGTEVDGEPAAAPYAWDGVPATLELRDAP
jgi:hypothetical protein